MSDTDKERHKKKKDARLPMDPESIQHRKEENDDEAVAQADLDRNFADAEAVMTTDVALELDFTPQPHPGLSPPASVSDEDFRDSRRAPPQFLLEYENMPFPPGTTLMQAAAIPGCKLYRDLVDTFGGADAFHDSLYFASFWLGTMLTDGHMQKRCENSGVVLILETSNARYAWLLKRRFPKVFTAGIFSSLCNVVQAEGGRRRITHHT